MRILVTAVFEQLVYHCTCIDERDPAHPRLEVDAILRDGVEYLVFPVWERIE